MPTELKTIVENTFTTIPAITLALSIGLASMAHAGGDGGGGSRDQKPNGSLLDKITTYKECENYSRFHLNIMNETRKIIEETQEEIRASINHKDRKRLEKKEKKAQRLYSRDLKYLSKLKSKCESLQPTF